MRNECPDWLTTRLLECDSRNVQEMENLYVVYTKKTICYHDKVVIIIVIIIIMTIVSP